MDGITVKVGNALLLLIKIGESSKEKRRLVCERFSIELLKSISICCCSKENG
jgi:hypothetical protein